MKPEKILYTAHATSTGGREGTSKTDDGILDVKLTTPKGLGGNGARGTNPEQLFAAGYSACFIGAMKFVAVQQKIALPADTSISADVGIGPIPRASASRSRCTSRSPAWTRRGAEARRGGAPGVPVLERDARQHRGRPRRRLSACGGALRRRRRRAARAGASDQLDARLLRRERAGRRHVGAGRSGGIDHGAVEAARAAQRRRSRAPWPRAARASSARATRPLPVPATTMPAHAGVDAARARRVPSAPASLGTISTRGHAAASLGRRSSAERGRVALRPARRSARSRPSSTRAIGPASPEPKASSR